MIKQRHLSFVKDVSEQHADAPATWEDIGMLALWLLPLPLLVVSGLVTLREGLVMWHAAAAPPTMLYAFGMCGTLAATLLARVFEQRPVTWLGYVASIEVLMGWAAFTLRGVLA